MNTSLGNEIERLIKINAKLVGELQSIHRSLAYAEWSSPANGAWLLNKIITTHEPRLRAVLAKVDLKPCARACESCVCHSGIVS